MHGPLNVKLSKILRTPPVSRIPIYSHVLCSVWAGFLAPCMYLHGPTVVNEVRTKIIRGMRYYVERTKSAT